MYVLIFCTSISKTTLIIRKTEPDTCVLVMMQTTLILVRFKNKKTVFFLDRFSKIQKSDFMKIRPVGAELFLADGQTDTKLIVASRNVPNAPKNEYGPAVI
jgi:hypothetical protein